MDLRRIVPFTVVGLISLAGPVASGQVMITQNPVHPNATPPPTTTAAPSSQTTRPQAPAFEVASVRLITPGSRGHFSISPPGIPRFTTTNATMRVLVEMAFAVPKERTLGAPTWYESQLYDVDAKVEGDRGLTYQEMKPLLQQLLRDRFHMASHREMKVQKGYALVIAKIGPKLQSSKGTSPFGQILPNQLQCPSCSMTRLAGILEQVTGSPVVDKTGIKGDFDIKLDYAPATDSQSSLPSIFTALQEQQGLKLVSQENPVEILVIDHVERIPTEN